MIGQFFKSNTSFICEEYFFIKNEKYKLVDVIDDIRSYTVYIFSNGNMFGEHINSEKKFKDRFSTIQEERVRTVNKLLYEEL